MKKHYVKVSYLFICIFFISGGLTFSSSTTSNQETSNHRNIHFKKADSFGLSEKKGKIKNFTLIDAVKNTDLYELQDGAKIHLSQIGTRHINIRANTEPSQTGSVLFKLSGEINYEHIENIAPYALYANDKNNYFRWSPQPGSYKLSATPFSKTRGTGEEGESLSISFQIVDDLQVIGFVLVNADDNKDILEIEDEMVIDLKKLPSQNINIRAITIPEVVGSVELSIADPLGDNFYSHIENAVPYALFSDHKGDYYGRVAENGSYIIKAIPYKSTHARGKQGYSLSMRFTMINGADFSASRFLRSEVSLESFKVFPNPGKNSLNIFLDNPKSQNVNIQIFDLLGNEVLYKNKNTENQSINIMLDVTDLENKPYIIKIISQDDVTSLRWLKE